MGGGMAPRKPSVCPTGTHIHLHGSPTRLPYACPEHGCYETSQTQTRRQSSGRSVAAVGFKGGVGVTVPGRGQRAGGGASGLDVGVLRGLFQPERF